LGTPTTANDCVSSPFTPAVTIFGGSPVVSNWDLHSPAFSVGTPYSTAVNTPYSAAPNTLQINDDSGLFAGLEEVLCGWDLKEDSPVLPKSHSGFAALGEIGFVNPVDVMHDPTEVADTKPLETKVQTQAAQQAAGDPASGSTTPLPPPDTPSTATGTPESHMPQTYVAASAPTLRAGGTFTPRPPVPIRPRPATEEAADRPVKRRKSSSEEDEGDPSGDKKTYPCPKCNRMFGRKFNMQTHLSTHDPNRVKPFECDHPGCGSKFTRKHDLKRHINGIHKGEKVGFRRSIAL
jgi:uncharacterized C2H2 Zn-finger protein